MRTDALHAAEELQRLHLGTDPVGGGLARGGTGVNVVRRSKGGYEDLRSGDLTGGGTDDRHGLAGVVDEQFLAGDVGLAHRAFEAYRPLAVLDAKAGVLEGQCVVIGVFLPQKLQGVRTHHVSPTGGRRADPRAAQSAYPSGLRQARVAGHWAQPGLELGYHQGQGSGEVDLLSPVRDSWHLQPLRRGLDDRAA